MPKIMQIDFEYYTQMKKEFRDSKISDLEWNDYLVWLAEKYDKPSWYFFAGDVYPMDHR